MKFSAFTSFVTIFLVAYVLFLSSAFRSRTAPQEKQSPATVKTIKQGSAAVKNARDFFYWYRDNLVKANSFPLLAKDPNGYYRLDTLACNNYLAFLKSSELLSNEYFHYQRVFFADAAGRITADTLKDQIPEGFDMDFVLLTQEPDLLLNKIDSLHFKVLSMNETVSLIRVTLPSDPSVDYELEMYKNRYSWRIGYISTPNYD